MRYLNSQIRTALLAVAASALVACGGGSEGPVAQVQAPPTSTAVPNVAPLHVEAFVPQSTIQDVPSIKARAVHSPAPLAAQIRMGPLLQGQKSAQDDGGARRVGAARVLDGATTDDGLAALLRWTKTPTGATVAALSVSVEGAHGMRLGLRVTALPGDSVLRVYSQQRPDTVYEVSGQQILQTLERNQAAGDQSAAARTWWTPELGDAEQTVELELPAGTDPRAVRLAIPAVSHIFEDLSLPQASEIAMQLEETISCTLDAICYEQLVQQRNAVARMLFTKGGSTYVCTGTLLNDSGSTGVPYFLSANHCISTQSVASTLQTDWFYRASSCNARTLSPQSTRRLSGATLLYAGAATDTSFMRLNDTPPPGATFAGWDASVLGTGAAVAGLHHPGGDLLKISFGKMVGLAECRVTSASQFSCLPGNGGYYVAQWSQGAIEGGSSGSALFRNGLVVGTLYGGVVTCVAADSAAVYGRFDLAYGSALKKWLAVASPGPTPDASSDRVAVFRFFNQKTGAHFYTASAGERDFVVRTYPDFRYENVAFYAYQAPGTDRNAVLRFYNRGAGAHFYTISAAERDFVQATYPAFSYEGPSWYAQTLPGGTATPMFRFFNIRTGSHFYTISSAERDFVTSNYPDFRYEGPAYYAWTAP